MSGDRHQEILYRVAGQTFYFDPPELYRPSGTPTVQVFLATTDDDGTAEAATTGACSVDSVNTTLSVAAAIGDTTLTLTSATGVTRLRYYLLTDTDGNVERPEVMGISGLVVSLRRPLVCSYASGSTFQGTRISISVDSTWASSQNKLSDIIGNTWRTSQEAYTEWGAGYAGYRLRWAYTTNSIATIAATYADLVRYSAKNLVTPNDVDRRFPGWIDRLPTDYRDDEGHAAVAEAFQAVRMDAIGDGQAIRRIRNTEILRELVILRANQISLENEVMARGTNTAGAAQAQELYEQRFNQLMKEPKYQTDQTGMGAGVDSVRLPGWRR